MAFVCMRGYGIGKKLTTFSVQDNMRVLSRAKKGVKSFFNNFLIIINIKFRYINSLNSEITMNNPKWA